MSEAPNPTTRRRLAAVGLIAGLGVGGVAGVALGSPGLSGAQETPTTIVPEAGSSADEAAPRRGSWIQESIAPLVEAGTINQAQADAVTEALLEARPEGRPRGHARMAMGLDAAATALGMTEDELRDELRDGRSLAEVATARGIDVTEVVDALVADAVARIDQKVAAGELDQDEADERKAAVGERITAIVNGERPGHPGHGRRGGR